MYFLKKMPFDLIQMQLRELFLILALSSNSSIHHINVFLSTRTLAYFRTLVKLPKRYWNSVLKPIRPRSNFIFFYFSYAARAQKTLPMNAVYLAEKIFPFAIKWDFMVV